MTSLQFCGLVSASILLLIIVFIVREAWPATRNIAWTDFVSDPRWLPHADASRGDFNLLPMVVGSLLVGLGATLLAALVGVASAVFGQFYARGPVALAYRLCIEILAGMPSVVYGLWGLVVLVPLIARLHPPGPSLLAGVLVLSVMIMPTVALFADAALARVPPDSLQGAAALGLTREAVIRSVALPGALGGIGAGVLLAAGRALGETMAVLMVCGNVVQMPAHVFEPVRTLTANIALEMAYALGDHRAALYASGVVFLVAVGVLVVGAEIITLTRSRRHA